MPAANSSAPVTFLLNWHATPYHAPIFLAHKLGFFAQEGVKVAILEPNDPSDVTQVIGSGKADCGLKAMIHTIAASARGYPVTSFGTLLDEPLTGLVHIPSRSGIKQFSDIQGKTIGYVGEFGKIIIDELTRHYGITPDMYTAKRVGMHVTEALLSGEIDAGVGLENVQCVEVEHRSGEKVELMRIDELAELGCCCFCSILFIYNDEFAAKNPEALRGILRASKRAMDYMLQDPGKAWLELIKARPEMDNDCQKTIFEKSLPYFSKTLENTPRDWRKVTAYARRLGLVDETFQGNYTNMFCEWPILGEEAPVFPGGVRSDEELVCKFRAGVKSGFKRVVENVERMEA